jgi:indolepyruvate ferredoxin oxidoreductase
LVGAPAAANLVVIGMAVQAGILPVTPSSLAEAVELNGVAVAANRAAIEWGRTAVADPDRVERALAVARPDDTPSVERLLPEPVAAALRRLEGAGAGDELVAATARRAVEVEGWGDVDDAVDYVAVVERAARAERAVAPGSEDLAAAVSLELYRVTAYKDEYEVARLLLDEAARREADSLVDGAARVRWWLHPPLLRAMGMERKIGIGTWAVPGFRLLARGKRVRGRALDPFGHTRMRRAERRLVRDYRRALDVVLDGLTAERHGIALEVARLPDGVRGYEDRKMAGIASFDLALADRLAAFARMTSS